jgi:hypothetical protein
MSITSTTLSLIVGLARQQAQAKRDKIDTLGPCAGRDGTYYAQEQLIREAHQLEKIARDVEAMSDHLGTQLNELERLARDNNLPEALAWLREKRANTPIEFVLDSDDRGRPVLRKNG